MTDDELKERLEEKSKSNDSRLILALDVAEEDIRRKDPSHKYLDIAREASSSVAAVKVGYPLVLKSGLDIIKKIKNKTDIPIIADFKIADVPHICRQIALCAYGAGAEGVIVHGFVGKDSLEAVVQTAEEEGEKGVIVVPSMSHQGGKTFIQKFSSQMLEIAKEVDVTGVIGPATRPEDVRSLRARVGEDILVLTPGIGAQGAQPGDAIRSGADYEIVGRAIYTSDSPEKAAAEIRRKINEVSGGVN